jgi:hypothetical protein
MPAPVAPPGTYVVVCSVHGMLPVIWVGTTYAGWDAIGHAAAHHQT